MLYLRGKPCRARGSTSAEDAQVAASKASVQSRPRCPTIRHFPARKERVRLTTATPQWIDRHLQYACLTIITVKGDSHGTVLYSAGDMGEE
jgi:hypothetical protein